MPSSDQEWCGEILKIRVRWHRSPEVMCVYKSSVDVSCFLKKFLKQRVKTGELIIQWGVCPRNCLEKYDIHSFLDLLSILHMRIKEDFSLKSTLQIDYCATVQYGRHWLSNSQMLCWKSSLRYYDKDSWRSIKICYGSKWNFGS